jgi:predicted AAA+ superfamily ATPase
VDVLPRQVTTAVREAVHRFRVIVINGPRQAGKSTLLGLLAAELDGEVVTLDDRTELRTARTDPTGFVHDRARPLLIDEVQCGGGIHSSSRSRQRSIATRIGWAASSSAAPRVS